MGGAQYSVGTRPSQYLYFILRFWPIVGSCLCYCKFSMTLLAGTQSNTCTNRWLGGYLLLRGVTSVPMNASIAMASTNCSSPSACMMRSKHAGGFQVVQVSFFRKQRKGVRPLCFRFFFFFVFCAVDRPPQKAIATIRRSWLCG